MVKDIAIGEDGSFNGDPDRIAGTLGNQVFFVLKEEDRRDLWTSDGSPSGTYIIHAINSAEKFVGFIEYDGKIIYAKNDGSDTQIWATNGALMETELIFTHDKYVYNLTINEQSLYFHSGGKLMSYNFSTGIKNTLAEFPEFGGIKEFSFVNDSTLVIIAATESNSGNLSRALFSYNISNNTLFNYYLIEEQLDNVNFWPNFNSRATRVGDKLFFFYNIAEDGELRRELLFVTDGTELGTQIIGEFYSYDFLPKNAQLAVGDKFYFHGRENDSGFDRGDLFVTDGTENGTIKLAPPDDPQLIPGHLLEHNGIVYFRGYHLGVSVGWTSIYSTDGTLNGTEQVISLGSSAGTYMCQFQDSIFFTSNGNGLGYELWKSDGSQDGSLPIDIVPGEESSYAQDQVPAEDLLYFLAINEEYGFELWVYDPLSINCAPVYSSIESEICEGDSIQVGGTSIAESGIFQINFNSPNGCDSIINLTVLLNQHDSAYIDGFICEGDFFQVGDSTYFTSGEYINSIINFNGCDSIVNLNLEVLLNSFDTINAEICDGDFFQIGDDIFSTSGTHLALLESANGCDSTVTLDLTVFPLPEIQLGNDTTIMLGDTLAFNLNNEYDLVVWPDGSNDNIFQFISEEYGIGEHEISVIVYDTLGCENVSSIIVSVEGPNSNMDIFDENIFSISPNPTSGFFTINLEVSRGFDTSTIELFSANNYLIKKVNLIGQKTWQWDEEQLIPGLYFVRVSSGGKTTTRKLIVH